MERQVYRLAGHAVEIDSLHSQVHEMCRAYRTQDSPELCLSIQQGDIDEERRRSRSIRGGEDAGRAGSEEARLSGGSDAYLETLAVYRKLAEALVERGILLFHGSALAVDGAGYIFAARSGMGKSTHARLWRELLGGRVTMVNDDKPLLEVTPAGVAVWGTPWDGKHHLSCNISVPLRAICLLERAEAENTIEPITAKEAWPALWRQCYRSADPVKLRSTMMLTDALSRSARLYRLRCTPEIEAARVAWAAMRKGEDL